MTRKTNTTRAAARPPTHPGAILREDVLPALDVTVAGAADDLGVSRQTLHRILSESGPVTPAMAVRLGKFCGNDAALWLAMQGRYDLWHAERDLRDEVRRIPKRAA